MYKLAIQKLGSPEILQQFGVLEDSDGMLTDPWLLPEWSCFNKIKVQAPGFQELKGMELSLQHFEHKRFPDMSISSSPESH